MKGYVKIVGVVGKKVVVSWLLKNVVIVGV